MKLPERQEGKLNIYYHIAENSGVGLFRQYLWSKEIQKQNLANVLINDFRWGVGEHKIPNEDDTFEIANWADIILTGRIDRPEWLAKWGGIREFFNMPVVMDTDDNVRHVRPSNPGYQGYHPGSEAEMWSKIAFSKVFNAITVSTKELQEFHSKEHSRIHILPNSLDLSAYKKLRKKNDGKIRIMFNGSSSHSESINIIKKPVTDIMKKYPQVIFQTPKAFKFLFERMNLDKEIMDRIEFMEWIPLKKWSTELAKRRVDIGLAPLTDNLFNRAKSNLRWLEFSALKVPVICSPVKAYENVEHMKTGLLAYEAENWYNYIETLINDEQLRKKLSENAYKEVSEQFNIEINVKEAVKIYQEIVDKYHKFFGRKKVAKQRNSKWYIK